MVFRSLVKTYFIQFTNKSTCTSDIQITYEDKQISIVNETKFLGLFINNNLSWKTHIECIKTKLSSACYAVRSVKPFLTINTLKMIYYSYFHSLMMTLACCSGETSQTAYRFLDCKKRSLLLWQVVDFEIHVENCLLT